MDTITTTTTTTPTRLPVRTAAAGGRRGPVLGAALLVLAAGCAQGVAAPPGAAPAPTAPVAAAEAGAPDTVAPASFGARSADGGYWPKSVQLGQHPTLGSVVLDGQGFTLYRFDRDSASPSRSTCVDACARQWPPVLANDRITFQNLSPSAIGAVTRADGTQQVTIGGWPVYRFIRDVVPGQSNGQGVGGTWFVVAPDGTRAGGGGRTGAGSGAAGTGGTQANQRR